MARREHFRGAIVATRILPGGSWLMVRVRERGDVVLELDGTELGEPFDRIAPAVRAMRTYDERGRAAA